MRSSMLTHHKCNTWGMIDQMMQVETEPEEIMCRNFFRGACNRGSKCIYSHKMILSQLKDVYRFCNDFQNTGCKRPKCKFVHASVFEKENFLRTGYLPKHTTAHFAENISVLPPPPPPPPQQGIYKILGFLENSFKNLIFVGYILYELNKTLKKMLNKTHVIEVTLKFNCLN